MRMMECVRCGVIFEPRAGKQKYCSADCRIKTNNEQRELRRKKAYPRKPVTLICEICDTSFETMHKQSRYCSIKCRRRAEYQAKKDKKAITSKSCGFCGKVFQPYSRINKYCSRDCQVKANIQKAKAGPEPKGKIDPKWLRRWGEGDDIYKHVRRSNYGTAGEIAC